MYLDSTSVDESNSILDEELISLGDTVTVSNLTDDNEIDNVFSDGSIVSPLPQKPKGTNLVNQLQNDKKKNK